MDRINYYLEYCMHINASQKVSEWATKRIAEHLENNPEDQGEVEHILDYLASEDAPNSTKAMTYKQAKINTDKWLKTLIKRGENIKESPNDTEVVLDFKDGFKIVKLVGENAFKREGTLMSHCAASYANRHDIEVYSLRDNKNMPHATMEKNQQIKGKGNGSIHPKYVGYVIEFLEYTGMIVGDSEMENLGYFNADEFKHELSNSLKYVNEKYLPIDTKLIDKNGKEFASFDLLNHIPLISEQNHSLKINFDLPVFIELSIKYLFKKIKIVYAGNFSQNTSSKDEINNASSGDNSQNASSGNYSHNASSGYNSQNASSGDYSQNASSGYSSQNASSGDKSHNASSGNKSRNASSGNYSQNASSGDNSQNASSGNNSHNASSGDYSQNASSGDKSHNASSGYNSQNASSGNNSHNASSGDYSQNASSGDKSHNASSGNKSRNASSGNYSQNASSGDKSHNASSGNYSQNASSGYYSQNASSGNYSHNASSGNYSQNASSGDYSQNASSGDKSHNASSGYSSHNASSGKYSHNASSGKCSHNASSGNYSQNASSGDYSQNASSGNYSHNASSGYNSRNASSGDYSQNEMTGKNSVSVDAGINGMAKGKKGCWFCLSEWKEENGKHIPICVKAVQIDGKIIKEDTWYKLKNGKFVEYNND